MDTTQLWLAALLQALSAVTSGGHSTARTVWSGRLGPQQAAVALIEKEGALRLEGGLEGLTVSVERENGLGGAACSAGVNGQLGVTVQSAGGAQTFVVVQASPTLSASVISRQLLPAKAASKPVAVEPSGASCAFALVLSDGSLWLWTEGGTQLWPNFLPSPADQAELPRGVFISAIEGVVIGALQHDLVAFDTVTEKREQRALSRTPLLPAVVLPGQRALLYADDGGQLSTYQPFSEKAPTVVADVHASTRTGLTVVSDRGLDLGVALGTEDGRIVLFDGKGLRELAQFAAPARVPLLAADVADLGIPQLVAALDDGSLGLVALDAEFAVGVTSFVALRSASRLALRIPDDRTPCAVVFDGAASAASAISLRDVTAAKIDRSGAVLWPGEAISAGVSRPAALHLTVSPPAAELAPKATSEQALPAGAPEAPGASEADHGDHDPAPQAVAADPPLPSDATADAPATVTRARNGCALQAGTNDAEGADDAKGVRWAALIFAVLLLRRSRRV